MPVIRTRFQPDTDLEVTDEEHAVLAAQGLLHSPPTPPAPVPAPLPAPAAAPKPQPTKTAPPTEAATEKKEGNPA